MVSTVKPHALVPKPAPNAPRRREETDMNACVCFDGSFGDELCEFCAANLYAISIEKRLTEIADAVQAFESTSVSRDALDDRLGDYIETSELKDAITDVIDLPDFDEFMTSDNVESELESYVRTDNLTCEIERALEDADIVKDIAAGAAEGVMRQLSRYALKSDVEQIANAAALVVKPTVVEVFAGLSFVQRLRLVFLGR
jgi:hypothetical protein